MGTFIDILKVYLMSMFSFVIQIAVGQLFFIPDIKKVRKGLPINIMIATIVNLLTSIISVLLVKLFLWNMWTNIFIYFFMVLGNFLSCYLIFDYQFKDIGLITVASFALQHILYQVYHLTFETFLHYWIYQWLGYELGYWMCVLLYYFVEALMYVASYFLLSRKFRISFQDNISGYKILIVSALTLLIALLLNSFGLFYNYGNYYMVILSGVFSILSSALVLFIIFTAFVFSSNKKQTLLMEAFYKEKLGQYQVEKRNVELINIKCHDLKKQVNSLMDKANISEKEIDEINEAINIYDSSISTGNEVIDTIIRQKILLCESKKITLTCMVDGKCFDKYEIEDIYSLFANILDNAIEAVDALKEKEKRFISVTATRKNSFIVLEETNYFSGNVVFNDDGSLKTSKNDSDYHGFGTKSIIHVANKYGGKCNYRIEKQRLILQMILPMEKCKVRNDFSKLR